MSRGRWRLPCGQLAIGVVLVLESHPACDAGAHDDRLSGDLRCRPDHGAGVGEVPRRRLLGGRAIGDVAHCERRGERRCGQEQQHHRRRSRQLPLKIHGSAGDPFKTQASTNGCHAPPDAVAFASVAIEVRRASCRRARIRAGAVDDIFVGRLSAGLQACGAPLRVPACDEYRPNRPPQAGDSRNSGTHAHTNDWQQRCRPHIILRHCCS
jgi:hypothetical protein